MSPESQIPNSLPVEQVGLPHEQAGKGQIEYFSNFSLLKNSALLVFALSLIPVFDYAFAQAKKESSFVANATRGPSAHNPNLSNQTTTANQGFSAGIIVNGDTVEYSMKTNEVTAQGNVSVVYQGTKLTCHKLTVNTQTKQATAEDHVQIEDKQGIIMGEKIIYDFNTKSGKIKDAHFVSEPFFGQARRLDKVSDTELDAFGGYATSCSLDRAHYRIKAEKIRVFPGEKIMTKGDTVFLGPLPILYLPRYDHSLQDPMMHIQVSPGKRKEWGAYLLTATRYSITDNVSGRIYLDYRTKLGVAEGFGTNYLTEKFGKGDFKYYYTHEKSTNLPASGPSDFQRYLIRWRHRWIIDNKTNIISEYYKIADSKREKLGTDYNFLREYFYREYEKDAQPLSYILLHHTFSNSGLDFIFQKRINNWFTQLEKLPEINYSLPSIQIGNSPFYFENNSSAANFNYKNAVPATSESDISVIRLDTYNKLSLPNRILFLQLTPYVGDRETYYNKNTTGGSLPVRTIFYTGMDVSTKFYRIFDVKSNFLNLDINGLRHIITPTINYSFNPNPTIKSNRIKQIDSLDAVGMNNSVALELSNKLQTKHKDNTAELLNFKINTSYIFSSREPATYGKNHGNFSDFLLKLTLSPYSWLRVDADAIYSREFRYFSERNFDINFNFAPERSIGLGQRYQKTGGNEITFNTHWRLNPKWKFGIYERYQFRNYEGSRKGMKEQQYTISRDLHCWELDMTYDIAKEHGHTIYFIFRLKAFPELEFDFNQNYNAPKSGSSQ